MQTKKSKVVSIPSTEVSASPEVTSKPRARAKSATSKTTSTASEKTVATIRHTRVSARKTMPVAETAASIASFTASINEADIAIRAYQIWQDNGCPEGAEVDNWMRAEFELRSMSAAQ